MCFDGGLRKITNDIVFFSELDVVALMQSSASVVTGRAKATNKAAQATSSSEASRWKGSMICNSNVTLWV